MMLKEKDTGAVYKDKLQRDREDEQIIMQLTQEFAKIDTNQNGVLNLEELVVFLRNQTNGRVDTTLAEAIFNEIDRDGNREIPLQEFVFGYF
jgi:Ca2+-binding EF-hand superfamily protein